MDTARASRLGPPQAAGLLRRDRLLERLDAARGSTLWVTGPAGSGKTSLLATWCEDGSHSTIWLPIDRSDRDATAFLGRLATCLPATIRADLPPLQAEHRADLPGVARRFLRAWYAAIEADAIVVLDSLNEALDVDDSLESLLPILARERPPLVTLALVSREGPATSLLALTSDPSTTSLDYEDLKCSREDVDALARLRGIAAPDLDLLARADGWIAGLSLLLHSPVHGSPGLADEAAVTTPGPAPAQPLLAQSPPAQAPPAQPLPAQSPLPQSPLFQSTLFTCFATQAFESLAQGARDLLLAFAFCPTIHPAMADRLLGRSDSSAVLDAIWRAQFFIERFAERRADATVAVSYDCHALLQSFLRERFLVILPRPRQLALWRAQAEAFEALGEDGVAFDLWLVAGDDPAAAGNLLDNAARLYSLGRFADGLDRVARLRASNAALVEQSADLAQWEGNYLRWTHPAGAVACHRRAFERRKAAGDTLGQLIAVSALLFDYLISWADWAEARSWVEEAHRLYTSSADSLRRTAFEHEVLSAGYAALMIYPDHPLVRIWFERGRELLASRPWNHQQLALSSLVMGYAYWNGHMSIARDLSFDALKAFRDLPFKTAQRLAPLFWVAVLGSADGHACDDDRRQAPDWLVELCETNGLKSQLLQAWIRKVQSALSRNDLKAGQIACRHVVALDADRPASRGMVLLCRIAVDLLRQDWQAVIDKAEAALARTPDLGGWVVGQAALRIELAEALAMTGHHARAAHHVEPVLRLARRWQSPTFEILSELVLAYGELDGGQLAIADSRIRLAFELARSEGFVALPWGAPPLFQSRLAARALQADIAKPWVRALIRTQRLPAPDAGLAHWPYRVRIQVIGGFRLDVDDVALPTQGRAQQRALELLKALIVLGAPKASRITLADLLWGGSERQAATGAFDIAVHRLRRLLGDPAHLLLAQGWLSLNPAFVDVDLWRSRQLLDRIDLAIDDLTAEAAAPSSPLSERETESRRNDPDPAPGLTLAKLALELSHQYPGELLAGDRDLGWILTARRTWRERLERTVAALANACLACRQRQAALTLIESAVEANPSSRLLADLRINALGRPTARFDNGLLPANEGPARCLRN